MRPCLALLLSLRFLAPQDQVSERRPVQALAASADEAFRTGKVDVARDLLLEALALEPDNMKLVFGLAQAERFLGECERAVELFDRFLRSDPDEQQREAAVAKRAECTDEPPPEPVRDVPVISTPPTREATPPHDAPSAPTPEPEGRHAVVGPVLVGVGVGLAVVGAVLVSVAYVRANRAPDASSFDEYERERASVRPLAIGGWSTFGVGASTALTGGIVWGVQRRAGRPVLQIEAKRRPP